MNPATHYQNLKVEQVWALMAFNAQDDKESPFTGFRSMEWWNLDFLCQRYTERLAFLEEMHGAHLMAPDWPEAPTGMDHWVAEARAGWAQWCINQATYRAWLLRQEDVKQALGVSNPFIDSILDARREGLRRYRTAKDHIMRPWMFGEGESRFGDSGRNFTQPPPAGHLREDSNDGPAFFANKS